MNMITLATRGSGLALWQANQVADRLRKLNEGLEVRILEVKTVGDRVQDRSLSSLSATGIFTKEVDTRVLAGEADAAVHSLKDQTTVLPDGLSMGMVLPRGQVEDALIGISAPTIAQLAPGARVATGSLRRKAQLLRARPDLDVVEIRGNVDGRIAQVDGGHADALILARAGLVRMGLEARITEVISLQTMLPAVSQGIVGITYRTGEEKTREILAKADDEATHTVARAERAFLNRLGGGCNVPAGGHAVIAHGALRLRGRVLDVSGLDSLESERSGPTEDAESLGVSLAEELLGRGADAMIAACRT